MIASKVGTPSIDPDDLDELLKKDPDDLTGIEKKQLQKVAKSKKYKQYLSNNQLKKLDATLKTLNGDNNNDKEKDSDDVATEYTPEMMAGLMTIAKKANEEEKDKTNKAKNDAMLDILAACTYDKNGEEIPMENRLEKMKDIVGENNWEEFKADIEKTYNKNKDNKDFLKALENAKNNVTKEDAESFVDTAKKQAKTTLEKVEKEKKEQAEIDKDIEDLQKEIDKENQNSMFKPEENEKLKELVDKLKKRQEDREKLSQNSVIGQAAPEAVANAQEELAKKEKELADKHTKDKEDEDKKSKDSQESDEDKESEDEYNKEGNDKNNYDDVDNTEDDQDDTEYESDEDDGQGGKKKLQNPAKIWRRRKNKRTGKLTQTYKHKLPNGTEESITKEEYKQKIQAYQKAKQKAQDGKKSDNNSLNIYTNLKNFLLEHVKFGLL
jgi:hypothetical protein